MLSGHSVCRSGVPAPGRPPPAPLPPAPTSSPAASTAVGLVPAESTESRSCSIAAPAAHPKSRPVLDTNTVAATARRGLGSARSPDPPGSPDPLRPAACGLRRLAPPRQLRLGLRPLRLSLLALRQLPSAIGPVRRRSQSLPPLAAPEAHAARTPTSCLRDGEGRGRGRLPGRCGGSARRGRRNPGVPSPVNGHSQHQTSGRNPSLPPREIIPWARPLAGRAAGARGVRIAWPGQRGLPGPGPTADVHRVLIAPRKQRTPDPCLKEGDTEARGQVTCQSDSVKGQNRIPSRQVCGALLLF